MFLFVCSLEFEIPPDTQKGEISTIEGFLMTAAKNLGMFQEERLQQNPEVGEKVREISRFMKMYMFFNTARNNTRLCIGGRCYHIIDSYGHGVYVSVYYRCVRPCWKFICSSKYHCNLVLSIALYNH